jgi:iron-sulfur cluster repair protein YtfE (RIC family)
MPSKQAIHEITIPVAVTYGNQIITLDAALERPFLQKDEWNALLEAAQIARRDLAFTVIAVEEIVDLQEEVTEADRERLKELKAEIKVIQDRMHQNRAERIAFLCPSWDVTENDEPDSPLVPCTPENLSDFSDELLEAMLDELKKKTGLSLTL